MAALLDLPPDKITFEGQAAMMLEALAEPVFEQERGGYYPILVRQTGDTFELQWRELWLAISQDLKAGVDKARIAARFQRTLVHWICQVARQLCEAHGLNTVALSGGVFQNQLLVQGCIEAFDQVGIKCLVPCDVPANDGGIALGQAVVELALMSR